MTGKPKLSDVYSLTVDLRPFTRCEPPDGQTCDLQAGVIHMTHLGAKRHALEHPGHYVIRDQIKRSSYVLRDEEADA